MANRPRQHEIWILYLDRVEPNIASMQKGNVCALYGVGDYLLKPNDQCVYYVLQRDEVDSSCKTYVNV
ncbi:unnamed protein product [Cylicocyclus nassatus]|uniref:Uncharacterized protein n=1 Tax=Cylicocyclus nassatus TaxID=53992 RepID=A0AA36M6N7_CYLNA|nr:unnamed protein product [Cylicocyclus nassatus]